MFSGQDKNRAKEIWLVDPAPEVIKQWDSAINQLRTFMETQGLACTPEAVSNLNGDEARGQFINHFKEIQRLKTQLDQYTDLSEIQREDVAALMDEEQLRGFRGMYLTTAKRLRDQRAKSEEDSPVQQLDFELVLFASAMIDYDYIMGLIADYTQESAKETMTRAQLIHLLSASSNLMEERDDIAAYINSLQAGESLTEEGIREGYDAFKAQKSAVELAAMAGKHGLTSEALQSFVDSVMNRMIFDGEKLTDLMAPLELGWKARAKAEGALMEELVPLLHKRAKGRDISGLSAYE